MSFIKDFISAIGNIFSGVINAAKKAYKGLSELEQKAAFNSSGILAIINASLDKTPAEIKSLVLEKYPELDPTELEINIQELVKLVGINIEEPLTFDYAISLLQKYLTEHEGNVWIVRTKTLVSLLAVIFAPNTTLIQKIELCLEYVYQDLIKGKIV